MKEKLVFTNSYGDELKGYSRTCKKAVVNLILLTGLCEYAERYEGFAAFLNENKINVYCLDHYGQGENVKEKKEYGTAPKDYFYKMADTIFELDLKLEEESDLPIYIAGHSMGSLVAQELIARHPTCSKRVVLIGTNGPMAAAKPGYQLMKLLTTKKNWDKVSNFAHKLTLGGYEKDAGNKKYPCAWISYNEENYIKYYNDERCNYRRSWGAQLGLIDGVAHLHDKNKIKKIDKNIDILIVCGQDDPFSNHAKNVEPLIKLYKDNEIKNVKYVSYPNMRHEILNEKDHRIVEEEIVKFLLK